MRRKSTNNRDVRTGRRVWSRHEITMTMSCSESMYLLGLLASSASDNIQTALEIFSILLFLQHQDIQITPRFIESLLSLREGEVFMVLSDLHSIISVPSPDEQNSPLRLFHASLGDFLTDRSRSGDTFFLDSGVCHRNIVNRIVKQLMNPASGSHLYYYPYSRKLLY